MVHNILQLITDNTDQKTIPAGIPLIINFIYGDKEVDLTFDEALIRLKEYSNKFNQGQIPK